MDLPVEAWGIIFSLLPLDDVIEVSAVCKTFYHETRNDKFFMKKMSQVRKSYRNERIICEKYYDADLCFSSQLSTSLKYYIPEETFFRVKNFFLNEIYYQILLFHVWNNLSMCKRSQFCVDICRSFCG